MGINVVPSITPTRKALTLTSGVSWTVPAGVTFVNVTLRGGGGGGAAAQVSVPHIAPNGQGGEIVSSTLTTTPGASISYAIGAGGTAGASQGGDGGTGGTTTFTGATSAVGGLGAGGNSNNYTAKAGTAYLSANNGATSQGNGNIAGAAGGVGSIDVEYWV
jgi:hypothetical protein